MLAPHEVWPAGHRPDTFFLRALERWDSEAQERRKTGRPMALSRAATEVLAIVAYRRPIARAGIELIPRFSQRQRA